MRTTRALAANALAGSRPLQNLPAEVQTKFEQALKEYMSSQLFNADRPESLVNLASLYAQHGQSEKIGNPVDLRSSLLAGRQYRFVGFPGARVPGNLHYGHGS
jgi:hypothetical protein